MREKTEPKRRLNVVALNIKILPIFILHHFRHAQEVLPGKSEVVIRIFGTYFHFFSGEPNASDAAAGQILFTLTARDLIQKLPDFTEFQFKLK